MTANPTDPNQKAFRETLALAKAGDQEALNDLFTSFYSTVKHQVHASLAHDHRMSRPWMAARFSTGDVVQEVFRSALTDLDAFGGDNERAFAGYLSMIVRNRVIDAIRFHEAERRDGRRAAAMAEGFDQESGDATPLEEAVSHDESERFLDLISDFPLREQLLLRGRLEDTASMRDLAEQLGYSSIHSAKRAYFAAKALLAVRLRPSHADGDDA